MSKIKTLKLIFPLLLAVIAGCGGAAQDSAKAEASKVDRIVSREARNAQKPNESKGLEIHRAGFERIFAGTAMQYGATFKEENLIDLSLLAHRFTDGEMVKSGASFENFPMAVGKVVLPSHDVANAPTVTLTGVPGFDGQAMRMRTGEVSIMTLTHDKDSFTGVPVIQGYHLKYAGRFGAMDDPSAAHTSAHDGVDISGFVRYQKD